MWRVAIEVRLEVGAELLLAGPRAQVPERELRGVVERLPGRHAQGIDLMGDAFLVQGCLHVQDRLLGW